MNELQKYNNKLESEWNELYHLLQDGSSVKETLINKKASIINLLSCTEKRLLDLNKTKKELAQQLNEITRITSATRLQENVALMQSLSRVLALLDDVNKL